MTITCLILSILPSIYLCSYHMPEILAFKKSRALILLDCCTSRSQLRTELPQKPNCSLFWGGRGGFVSKSQTALLRGSFLLAMWTKNNCFSFIKEIFVRILTRFNRLSLPNLHFRMTWTDSRHAYTTNRSALCVILSDVSNSTQYHFFTAKKSFIFFSTYLNFRLFVPRVHSEKKLRSAVSNSIMTGIGLTK